MKGHQWGNYPQASLIWSMARGCRECLQARGGRASYTAVFCIIRAVLNILENIHDIVAILSTLRFNSCSFIMRITSAFLVGLWAQEYMLFNYILSDKCWINVWDIWAKQKTLIFYLFSAVYIIIRFPLPKNARTVWGYCDLYTVVSKHPFIKIKWRVYFDFPFCKRQRNIVLVSLQSFRSLVN